MKQCDCLKIKEPGDFEGVQEFIEVKARIAQSTLKLIPLPVPEESVEETAYECSVCKRQWILSQIDPPYMGYWENLSEE